MALKPSSVIATVRIRPHELIRSIYYCLSAKRASTDIGSSAVPFRLATTIVINTYPVTTNRVGSSLRRMSPLSPAVVVAAVIRIVVLPIDHVPLCVLLVCVSAAGYSQYIDTYCTLHNRHTIV